MLNYEQADERAKKFFDRVFVGTSVKGADSSGRKMSWNSSHEDLTPTLCHTALHASYCAYCGQTALPIQANLRQSSGFTPAAKEYDVTGRCCICKDAMDEVANSYERRILEHKHKEELEALAKLAPTPSVVVKERLVHATVAHQLKQLKGGWTADFSSLGVKFGDEK